MYVGTIQRMAISLLGPEAVGIVNPETGTEQLDLLEDERQLGPCQPGIRRRAANAFDTPERAIAA